MAKAETWVEVDTYSNSRPDGSETAFRRKGDVRRTEKLVEGRWLVRWWKRVR